MAQVQSPSSGLGPGLGAGLGPCGSPRGMPQGGCAPPASCGHGPGPGAGKPGRDGGGSITQHQLQAFATVVDSVYGLLGPGGAPPAAPPPPLPPPPHPAAAARLPPPRRWGQPPWAQPPACFMDVDMDVDKADLAAAAVDATAGGAHGTVMRTATSAAQLTVGAAAPLLQLPLRHLPRRWTDTIGLAAAAAAARSAALAAPPAPSGPCHLLELPDELLALVMWAAADPSTPPTVSAAAAAAGGGSPSALAAACSSPSGGDSAAGQGLASPPASPWNFAAFIGSPVTRRRGGRTPRPAAGAPPAQPAAAGGASGLRSAAAAAMCCRRLVGTYRHMLAARPDMALQAEAALRAVREKRRLVRRLTMQQHDAYVARELAVEGTAGAALVAGAGLLCGAAGVCSPAGGGVVGGLLATLLGGGGRNGGASADEGIFSGGAGLAVFAAVQLLTHTAVLAAAYRASACLGTRRCAALGLAALAGLILVALPAAQALLALAPLPSTLLGPSPWGPGGTPASPPPPSASPLVALLWPLYGECLHRRLVQLLSYGFAWAYGSYEWGSTFSAVRAKNGLRY